MYFINWAMTGIAELIAIGLYFQYFFPGVPVEINAVCALALLVGVNLLSVKAFGEFEFWAACLKVGAIELVGITAGEMKDPEREVPKAIRAVVLRIVVFYIGSVSLLAMIMPSDNYKSGDSPFVTVFATMGRDWVDRTPLTWH